MITKRRPWDYSRTPKPPSPRMREMEKAIVAWVTDLVKYEKRGLLTHNEFIRLVEQGPAPKEPQS